MTLRRDQFGDDFTWGVASAAFQVEGAWDVDGKRPSVWDEACRIGKVRGGVKSLDAIDAYHHLDEDLDLIAGLGVTANRFSINWTRVFGDGRGPWNDAGGSYYDRPYRATSSFRLSYPQWQKVYNAGFRVMVETK